MFISEPIDPATFKPLNDWVLLKIDKPDIDKGDTEDYTETPEGLMCTKAGFVLGPRQSEDKKAEIRMKKITSLNGMIVSFGFLAFDYLPAEAKPKIGDKVLVAQGGTNHEDSEGNPYRLIQCKSFKGIL